MQSVLKQGEIPSLWKIAKVIPVAKPKKLDPTTTEAYRSISLINIMAKLLEKYMATKLQEYGEKSGAILPSQMGCRRSRSMIDALISVCHRVASNLKIQKDPHKE